jgi:hypothetical protein
MAFLDRVQADQGPTWLTESSPLFLTCNVQKRSQTGCWPPWRGFATHYRLDYSRTCDKGFFSEILTVLMLMTGKFDPFLMPVGQGCRLVTFHESQTEPRRRGTPTERANWRQATAARRRRGATTTSPWPNASPSQNPSR